VLAIANHEAQS